MIHVAVTLRAGTNEERLGFHQFEYLPSVGHQITLEGFSGVATVISIVHHTSKRAPHTEVIIAP